MSYNFIEQYSCTFTGGPMDPQGFAIHWWGDPAQHPTFMGTISTLLERSRQQSAAANFVAEDGQVACLVSPNVVAWAQGDGANGWGNRNLASIECNPRCTAGDRETVAELMADQHILNGIPLVAYPHNKFTATQCPGVWEQWIPWLVSRAGQIVAAKRGTPAPAAVAPAASSIAPAPAASAGEIYWTVDPGDTLSGIAGYYGITVEDLAGRNGITDPNRLDVGQRVRIV